MKYFDWRIDDDETVQNLLWLREKDDGTISVTREYDGVWQWSKEHFDAVDRVEPNIILNSQQIVTDTCLGEATIKAWKANDSPSKEPLLVVGHAALLAKDVAHQFIPFCRTRSSSPSLPARCACRTPAFAPACLRGKSCAPSSSGVRRDPPMSRSCIPLNASTRLMSVLSF